jgi:hypothetical protein
MSKFGKDAYDVLLAVTGFVDGSQAAVAAFHAEATAGNSGYGFARTTLERFFSEPEQDGPVRAAAFHPGNINDRDRIRQDVVTIGQALLGS